MVSQQRKADEQLEWLAAGGRRSHCFRCFVVPTRSRRNWRPNQKLLNHTAYRSEIDIQMDLLASTLDVNALTLSAYFLVPFDAKISIDVLYSELFYKPGAIYDDVNTQTEPPLV